MLGSSENDTDKEPSEMSIYDVKTMDYQAQEHNYVRNFEM